MSRLLTTLRLYRCGYVVGRYISLESKIEKTKENYYDVLEQYGIHWHENENDPAPFIKYMFGIVLAAYRDFETRISLVDEKSQRLGNDNKAGEPMLARVLSGFSCPKNQDVANFLKKNEVEFTKKS